MRLWTALGLGATAGAGLAVVLRLRSRAQWESTADDGVLEERSKSSEFDIARPSAEGRALIEDMGRRAGMSDAQVQFLVFVASKESRFRPNVGRGDPNLEPPGLHNFLIDYQEANAARRAYERNAKHFADCGHDPAAYSFGSGGLFAFLPTYPLYHLRKTPLRCAHPYEVFDPAFSITAAYSFARGLSRHRYFDGSVAELRAGWGALAWMKDSSRMADRMPGWRAQLRGLGIDDSWLQAQAPKWPKRDLMTLYRSMGGRLARVA